MANTIKLGTDSNWAVKENNLLAYNDENNIFKPIDFEFTRDSGATRVNEQGLIENVPSGVPRIDFKDSSEGSLLLEPSRTNLIPSNVSDWVVFQSNVTQSNQSPDGYNNAIKITSNAVVNSGVYFSGLSVSGNTEIFTIWLKGENGGEILEIGDATNRTTVTLTNEWVRYEAKAISASAFKILYNQTTNPIVQTWYAWGPQLEDNVSYATSYIPTNGSAVTRSAETCSKTGLENFINSSEGVLYAEFNCFVGVGGGTRRIDLGNSAIPTEYVRLQVSNSTGELFGVINNGTQQALFSTTGFDATTYNKVALKYKENDFALWVNGVEVGVDLSGTTFSASTLSVLSFNFPGSEFIGKVKDLRVYNTALTDAELIALTS